MRQIIYILLSLLVVPALVFAQEADWSIEGKAITVDNCVVGCPCIFGEQPTHGRCQYFAVMQIDKGNYGEINLDNTRFALGGAFGRPKEEGSQQVYDFVAYYVDANAKAEQKDALKKMLAGKEFEAFGKPVEVQEHPIQVSGIEEFGQVDKTYQGTVGDIALVKVTPVSGAQAGKPIVVENSAEPLFNWTALGKSSESYYKGANVDWKFEGTSGESHKFSIASGAQETTHKH